MNLFIFGCVFVGVNCIFIIIDLVNDLVEFLFLVGENNNNLVNINGEEGVFLFVVDNIVVFIWLMEFGIVGNLNLVLKFFSLNVFIGE